MESEGEDHVRTELKTSLALWAIAIGVNQAADSGNIVGFELGDCGVDLDNTTDDLMSGNTWIDSRHRAPFATDSVKIRVAYTGERDFEMNVLFTWIAPRDGDGSKRRYVLEAKSMEWISGFTILQ
jgi:hypothetical protein